MVNEVLPKNLREDIEWAVEVISSNKLYNGNLHTIDYDEGRPEISVWTKMISGENIPINKEEMKRLKEFEDLHNLDNQRKNKRIPEKKIEAKEATDELGET